MKLLIGLGWFSLYLHRKPKFGFLVQQPSLWYTRIGTFPPTATGIREVLSPECEDGHTRDLCLLSLGLPPHFQTYPRSTCKILLDSEPQRSFSNEILLEGGGVGPGRLPPPS